MSEHQRKPTDFSLNIDTTNEFFVGNLNKTKTRDEIFQDLTSIKIKCLNENLYISKFNMPKFNARKDSNGNLLLNLGYAFVTTKKPEMAAEMIERKRIQLADGSDIEIKPVCRTKRMMANAACKNKNAAKFNQTVGDGRSMKSRSFSSNSQNDVFQNSSYQPYYYNSNLRSSSRLCTNDFSRNQTFHNLPRNDSLFETETAKSLGNLIYAPASLHGNQNNSNDQIWPQFEEQKPIFDKRPSIFDMIASASSDDDRSSENLVSEKLFRSAPTKMTHFDMTQSRERLWSNQSRS